MEVSQEIRKANSRLKKNKLILNFNKTIDMIVGNCLFERNAFNMTINSNVIPHLSTVKYSGVILDHYLTTTSR